MARTLLLSGNMNTFVDGWPVYLKASASSGHPAPDVAPMSRIPVRFFQFSILRAQCAAILLHELVSVSIDDSFSFLGVGISMFSCLST